MPGGPAGRRDEGPVGPQSGGGGDLASAVQDGEGVPLEAGQAGLDHPFFYGFAQPSRRSEAVSCAPGPQLQRGDLGPVQPEVPGTLGLPPVIGGLADDPPGAAVQSAGEGQRPLPQGNGTQPGDQEQRLIGAAGVGAVGQADLGGGVRAPAQPEQGVEVDCGAVLVPPPYPPQQQAERPAGDGVGGAGDEPCVDGQPSLPGDGLLTVFRASSARQASSARRRAAVSAIRARKPGEISSSTGRI